MSKELNDLEQMNGLGIVGRPKDNKILPFRFVLLRK